MKKVVIALALSVLSTVSFAELSDQLPITNNVYVDNYKPINQVGLQFELGNNLINSINWNNDIYHSPQYMPGYPTAATIFPRVVDVDCVRVINGISCKGYNWLPEMGRGEYLMVHPVIHEPPQPQIITKIITKEVLVEVPVKKKGE